MLVGRASSGNPLAAPALALLLTFASVWMPAVAEAGGGGGSTRVPRSECERLADPSEYDWQGQVAKCEAQAAASTPTVQVTPRQFGCIEANFCILGPDDVSGLPDRGGSLGLKIVGTSHVEIGGKKYPYKFFDIYDITKGAKFPRFVEPGVRLIRVNGFLFHDEVTLATYVRSLNPGQTAEIGLQDWRTRDKGYIEGGYIDVVVHSASAAQYDTELPEYVTTEYAATLATNQTVLAAIAAAKDVAPYILLYLVGTKPGLIAVYGRACIAMGTEC